MRYQVGTSGVGGNNESWFYAEYEAETGKAFWVHEWENMTFSLQTSSGEKRIPLEDASDKRFYKEAAEIIQKNHPEWQPLKD
ncbi:hypothetical protein D3C77_558610 [compost metagenome]